GRVVCLDLGPLAGGPRAVLCPPARRGEPRPALANEDAPRAPEGAPEDRLRRRAARRGALPSQAGLHDPARGLAPPRPSPDAGRAPGARSDPRAGSLRGRGVRAAHAGTPERRADPRRPPLDLDDGGSVDARVPRPAWARHLRVRGG